MLTSPLGSTFNSVPLFCNSLIKLFLNLIYSTSVFGFVICLPLCLKYVSSKLISSTLNFSLKKFTLNAFWSNVILLQISVGTELNSLRPVSSTDVNSFSAINDDSILLLISIHQDYL